MDAHNMNLAGHLILRWKGFELIHNLHTYCDMFHDVKFCPYNRLIFTVNVWLGNWK